MSDDFQSAPQPPPRRMGRRAKPAEGGPDELRKEDDFLFRDDLLSESKPEARLVSNDEPQEPASVAKKPRRIRETERPEAMKETRGGWDSPAPESSPPRGGLVGGTFTRGKSGSTRREAQDVEDIDDDVDTVPVPPPRDRREKIKQDSSDDAVTVIIPDLDQVQDNQMLTEVAAAPVIKINRFKNMQELDGELLASTGQLIEPPTSLAGIDVSLLVSTALIPPDQLVKPDVQWDWDVIFTEVTSDLHVIQSPVPSPQSSPTRQRV
ncbi:intraflagellar transport protein 43-domain-containing protein [Fimicolochytrium jonesii]|uniref:intraflagellar transport protein 43-domain-containing protein n=1 Tax=Fimicolochytrium jonesii TaxID=1396493 RepID=UPI0022FDD8DD|nr:intraflagellar transport protein 43-domain-containing protein [Fimicolochytrium jonesii]KAI8815817.1 intraflagellar transport protein 43-domain-containing protein [Fimicolochytrium jonesii]